MKKKRGVRFKSRQRPGSRPHWTQEVADKFAAEYQNLCGVVLAVRRHLPTNDSVAAEGRRQHELKALKAQAVGLLIDLDKARVQIAQLKRQARRAKMAGSRSVAAKALRRIVKATKRYDDAWKKDQKARLKTQRAEAIGRSITGQDRRPKR